MIRVSRMADYGVVTLTFLARQPQGYFSSSRIAERTGVPLPTVCKLLKTLVKSGVVVSRRGSSGGYGLARPADQISVADLVVALDGPIALADCLQDTNTSVCGLEGFCTVRGPWQKVSEAIRVALEEVTLASIAGSFPGDELNLRADRQEKPSVATIDSN